MVAVRPFRRVRVEPGQRCGFPKCCRRRFSSETLVFRVVLSHTPVRVSIYHVVAKCVYVVVDESNRELETRAPCPRDRVR